MGGGLSLGIDLGSSAVKVVALAPDGTVLAAGEAPFPTHRDAEGAAEQDPADWLAATAAAVGELGRACGSGWSRRVSAIGLAGQLPTLVCLGRSGPVGRAVTWMDSRADAWAAGLIDAVRRLALYRATGMPIDGRYLAPMFRRHFADRAGEVRLILSAKDFLCRALTGVAVTDPSTAAGYGVWALATQSWDAGLCAFWGLDPALLPAIRPAASTAGPLGRDAAARLGLPEGVPVAVGAADSVAAAYAMGGLGEGTACIAMGSSTVVMDAGRDLPLDPAARYLLTPHAQPGWLGREMDLLATGTGHRWLRELLGWAPGELEARAAAAPPGAGGLLFAPYLAGGEQGALWDPRLRGVIHGLTVGHGPGDLARAFLEGVWFELRRCLSVLDEHAPVRAVRLAGHPAGNSFLLALAADIIGRPVSPWTGSSAAALGAALLADPALPRPEDLAGGAFGGCVTPGPAADLYDGIYRRYLDLFPEIAARGRTEACA
jgi:xylulokinase